MSIIDRTPTTTDTDTDLLGVPYVSPVERRASGPVAPSPYAGVSVAVSFIVAMIVGGAVLVVMGYGNPASRAALGLDAPVVATVHVSAAAADAYADVDESSPRWSCLADGNRLCGPFHGPSR